MIEINLLPGAKKKKTTVAASGGPKMPAIDFAAIKAALPALAKDKFLIGGLSAFVLAMATSGYLFLSQRSEESSLKTRYESGLKDSIEVNAKIRNLRHALAIRDTLLREVHLVENIDADRFIWPHVMETLSRNLPRYTWLLTVAYFGTPQATANVVAPPPLSPSDTSADERKKHPYKPPKPLPTDVPKDAVGIRLVGHTVDIQAVAQYMNDLEDSRLLSNVTLDLTQSAVDQGKEVTQFQLTMLYARPDSTSPLLKREPFRLTASPPPDR